MKSLRDWVLRSLKWLQLVCSFFSDWQSCLPSSPFCYSMVFSLVDCLSRNDGQSSNTTRFESGHRYESVSSGDYSNTQKDDLRNFFLEHKVFKFTAFFLQCGSLVAFVMAWWLYFMSHESSGLFKLRPTIAIACLAIFSLVWTNKFQEWLHKCKPENNEQKTNHKQIVRQTARFKSCELNLCNLYM